MSGASQASRLPEAMISLTASTLSWWSFSNPGNPIIWACTESVPQVRWPCAAVEFASKKPTEKRMQILQGDRVGFAAKLENPADGCIGCMKITKLQHELHGIHVVDSGAVLPRPHHLALTSSAQLGIPMAMQPTSGVAVTG